MVHEHEVHSSEGGGEVNFNYLPRGGGGGGESEKLRKRGGSMVQGQVLKGGGWHFSYLIFSMFVIFTFRNYFTLCKIMLCI